MPRPALILSILLYTVLICAVLFGTGIFWYLYTKPIAITGYVPSSGGEPSLSGVPTTTPQQVPPTSPDEPTDTRSWGERLRDPAVPDVRGVIWQTYTDKEYGFQIEYPKGFWIETSMGGNKDTGSSIYVNPSTFPNPELYGTEHPYGTLLAISVSVKSLRESVGQGTYLDERFKKQDMIPDAVIRGIDFFVDEADAESDKNNLRMYFEKYGHTYYLVEAHSNKEDDKKMIEHMVKTFRFLK